MTFIFGYIFFFLNKILAGVSLIPKKKKKIIRGTLKILLVHVSICVYIGLERRQNEKVLGRVPGHQHTSLSQPPGSFVPTARPPALCSECRPRVSRGFLRDWEAR